MVKIYGTKRSRALRCFWLATELGIEFEKIPVQFGTDSRQSEFLAINPNGRVPAMVDGNVTLFESMAINLYLARKYPAAVSAQNLVEEAYATQWSVWALTEVEAAANVLLFHRVLHPEEKRDEARARESAKQLAPPMAVLDGALATRPYLLGDRFTVADLNVASVVAWAKLGRFDFGPYPHVDRWLRACLKRPAQRAVMAE